MHKIRKTHIAIQAMYFLMFENCCVFLGPCSSNNKHKFFFKVLAYLLLSVNGVVGSSGVPSKAQQLAYT